MIKLCICDDQLPEQEKIKALAEAFTKQYPLYPLHITAFSSPYDVLEHTTGHGGFDIYLLDMLMPDINGLKLAEKIRGREEGSDIIFLTTTREYGVEAFEVKASGYLVKPVSQEKFNETLLEILKRRSAQEIKYILLKTYEKTVRLPQNEIIMIESINRERIISLVGGQSLKTRLSLTSLQELLAESDSFISPRRSYIINLEHVRGFYSGGIEMSNGTAIPMSKTAYSEFKKKYMEFVF